MFPDLTRDDVFRLETQRLWLRWPRAADAAAITAFASRPEVAQMTAAIPHPYPAQEADRFIFEARADNAAGRALHLALTLKGAPRTVVGLVSAIAEGQREVEIGYAIAPEMWDQGYASEAARILVDTVFALLRRSGSSPTRASTTPPPRGAGEERFRLCRYRPRPVAGARRPAPVRPLRTRPRALAGGGARPARDGAPARGQETAVLDRAAG